MSSSLSPASPLEGLQGIVSPNNSVAPLPVLFSGKENLTVSVPLKRSFQKISGDSNTNISVIHIVISVAGGPMLVYLPKASVEGHEVSSLGILAVRVEDLVGMLQAGLDNNSIPVPNSDDLYIIEYMLPIVPIRILFAEILPGKVVRLLPDGQHAPNVSPLAYDFVCISKVPDTDIWEAKVYIQSAADLAGQLASGVMAPLPHPVSPAPPCLAVNDHSGPSADPVFGPPPANEPEQQSPAHDISVIDGSSDPIIIRIMANNKGDITEDNKSTAVMLQKQYHDDAVLQEIRLATDKKGLPPSVLARHAKKSYELIATAEGSEHPTVVLQLLTGRSYVHCYALIEIGRALLDPEWEAAHCDIIGIRLGEAVKETEGAGTLLKAMKLWDDDGVAWPTKKKGGKKNMEKKVKKVKKART
ncbi:unnamed protein product [Peniophora sp. CBMAI 1063]|nr:unnamed protein product [Peniophora sp. CBMAI 1063]